MARYNKVILKAMKKILYTAAVLFFCTGLTAQNQDGNQVVSQDNTGNRIAYNINSPSSSYTVDDEGRISGQYVKRFDNGQLKEFGVLDNGERNGIWMTWTDNGVKTSEAHYLQGKKNGVWYIWDKNGNIRYEMHYKDGNKVGTWKMWDANGNLVSQKSY